METIEIISKNLIAARGRMSRQELAEKAKISYQAVRDIEEKDRNPSIAMLQTLANALGITIVDLLRSDSEPKPVAMPVSKTLQKMMNVPDQAYDFAADIDPGHKVWRDVLTLLGAAAEESRQAKMTKKA